MTARPVATVERILRYPVKGLSPEDLGEVALQAGAALPFDRAWAIESGSGRFDPGNPKYLPKINFYMLMRDELLAGLTTTFDEHTGVLEIRQRSEPLARGNLRDAAGCREIESFIRGYFGDRLRGAPKVVHAPGHSFSDVSAKCVHVVNRASLEALSNAAGREIDEVRFRPNLVVDGWPAWHEFSLLGETIYTEGGVALEMFKRTERCAATNVDPVTGRRDMTIPELLKEHWGHTDFGVYAMVVTGGTLRVGSQFS